MMREADLSKDTSGPESPTRTPKKLVCRRTYQLGDEGLSSGGTKLNSVFTTVEEDLSQPWLCEENDLFTARIRNFKVPKRTRMPTNVKTYDGTGDPEDHLKIFQTLAKIKRYNYEVLRKAFLGNFSQQKKYIKDPVEIHYIKQKEGESTEAFIERFKAKSIDGQESSMVIEAEVEGHLIHRMYVDGGSASEHSTSTLMNFMFVQSPLSYNSIIGRLGLIKVQAIPSTAHEMIKFPLKEGIVMLHINTIIPAERRMVAEAPKEPPPNEPTKTEGIKVAIHPEYLEQTVTIGGSLSKKGRMELCDLLKNNLDVFAWKPADMTCVPRSITEHHLNIRKRYACKGYPQIHMAEEDEEKTTFHTSQRLYCYTKISFGLKNAIATYQRLVDKAFEKQSGRRDVPGSHCKHEGNKSISGKRRSVMKLHSPRTLKEVQSLNGKLASLSRFLSNSAKRSLPFFKTLKNCIKIATSSENSTLLNFDFIAERLKKDDPSTNTPMEEEVLEPWILFTDGSPCLEGPGARLILIDPEGVEFTSAFRFKFDASNNETEYEALMAGLLIAEQMGVQNLTAKEIISGAWLRCVGPLQSEYVVREIHKGSCSMHSGPRDNSFMDWCEKLNIKQRFASVKHPQNNGQMERANHSLGEGIKARLGGENMNWVVEVPYVLWAHRTMIKSSNEDTSFSLTYDTEAVIPVKIGMPSLSNEASHAKEGEKLGPKWEGPYEVVEALEK
uniref:Reverse transcriptase domain-containing protein n=1 Tax=Tanacetum cinerariifolium TaxID=118510 RepID=A0A699H8N0_TANCI|nr:reverse transcriptase domain-containing protein [Tanacetum cinerariifolium]